MTNTNLTMGNFIRDKDRMKNLKKEFNRFENHFKFARYKGSHYKLPLNAFMMKIFELNEKAVPQHKWTDIEIAVKVRREYAKFEQILKSWQPDNYEKKVLDLRHRYNRGILVASMPSLPEKLSYRHDKEGKIICAKFSNKNFQESVEEWKLQQECKYSALAYYQMDQGVYPEDLERDWFRPEDHPYVIKEMERILVKAKEARKKHDRGTLRKKKKNG